MGQGAGALNKLSIKNSSSMNKMIETAGMEDMKQVNKTVKILFLGTGGSGKSSLIKQLNVLYHNQTGRNSTGGIVQEDNKTLLKNIRNLIVSNLKTLHKHSMLAKKDKYSDPDLFQCAIVKKNKSLKKKLFQLWKEICIQDLYRTKRHALHLDETLPYFMSKFWRLFADDIDGSSKYEVTEQDWIRCRRRSSGVIESSFVIENVQYQVVDVGGQRNQRKKWIHAFENVNLVVWVLALNEFNRVLFEDHDTNRMLESFIAFEESINDSTLNRKSPEWVLFLNKTDLLKEDLKLHKISDSFPGFREIEEEDLDQTYDRAIEFFITLLKQRAKEKWNKILTVHLVCALDQKNVHKVFERLLVTLNSNG